MLIGASVRLRDRIAVVGEGDEKKKVTIPGRGLSRVGQVIDVTRALGRDERGRSVEVENCKVEFPQHKQGGKTFAACVEVWPADMLEVVRGQA